MRLTRTMMLDVLRQDYIRTGWAKGLKEKTIIVTHGSLAAFGGSYYGENIRSAWHRSTHVSISREERLLYNFRNKLNHSRLCISNQSAD